MSLATSDSPGSPDSPAADDLSNINALLQQAAAALNSGRPTLRAAISALPPELTWESLRNFAADDPSSFEQVSLLAVGAYFMSPDVLAALGFPSRQRLRADPEQVVDELSSGILDAVYERGCPVLTLDQINDGSHHG